MLEMQDLIPAQGLQERQFLPARAGIKDWLPPAAAILAIVGQAFSAKQTSSRPDPNPRILQRHPIRRGQQKFFRTRASRVKSRVFLKIVFQAFV